MFLTMFLWGSSVSMWNRTCSGSGMGKVGGGCSRLALAIRAFDVLNTT